MTCTHLGVPGDFSREYWQKDAFKWYADPQQRLACDQKVYFHNYNSAVYPPNSWVREARLGRGRNWTEIQLTEVLADGTSEVSHMEAMGLSTPHGPIFGSGLPLREVITGEAVTFNSGKFLESHLSAVCNSHFQQYWVLWS